MADRSGQSQGWMLHTEHSRMGPMASGYTGISLGESDLWSEARRDASGVTANAQNGVTAPVRPAWVNVTRTQRTCEGQQVEVLGAPGPELDS